MKILFGTKGAKPPPSPFMETFQYLNTLAFASNHIAPEESIFYQPLFSPPHELDHPLFSPQAIQLTGYSNVNDNLSK